MMKKFVLFIAVVALVLGLAISASADSIEFVIDSDVMYSEDIENGFVSQKLETAPYETQGRTMVPVRIVTESFGADVTWDEAAKTVGIKGDGIEVTLTIDSNKAYVNGSEYILDVPATEINGRTMVPVRFVSEQLKYNVEYNDTFRSVYITNEQPVMTVGSITYNRDDIRAYKAGFAANEDIDEVYDAYVKNLEQFAMFSQEADKTNLPYDEESYNELLQGVKTQLDGLRKEAMVTPYADVVKLYAKAHAYAKTLDITVTDEDMQKVYEAKYYCAKHVLIAFTDMEEGIEKTDAEKAKLEDTAKKILAEAKAGADFDRLVDEYSEDPSKVLNTEGMVFTKGMMVKEFEDAVVALEIGEIGDIVVTQYGYHIVKRVELPERTNAMEEILHTYTFAEKITEATEAIKVNYEINVGFTFEDLKAMFVK